jgi:2-polyprenyl-3-methyl-5-hydroxy-6-metoxy-1,4-benzoquinol methylase
MSGDANARFFDTSKAVLRPRPIERFIMHAISRLLPRRDDGVAWDLGCGYGKYALLLSRHHAKVNAVDASEGMIRQAILRKNITYILDGVEAAIGKLGRYNSCVAIGLMELVDDPMALLRVLANSAEDDGVVLLVVPERSSSSYLLLRLLLMVRSLIGKPGHLTHNGISHLSLRDCARTLGGHVRLHRLVHLPVYGLLPLPARLQRLGICCLRPFSAFWGNASWAVEIRWPRIKGCSHG